VQHTRSALHNAALSVAFTILQLSLQSFFSSFSVGKGGLARFLHSAEYSDQENSSEGSSFADAPFHLPIQTTCLSECKSFSNQGSVTVFPAELLNSTREQNSF
jgi:hypothetical protein